MKRTHRKSIQITVIESDQIVQHILPVEEKELKKKCSTTKDDLIYSANFSPNKKSHYQSEENEDDSSGTTILPSVSQDDKNNTPIEGIFKFRTPKRSGQMTLKAVESLPGTPKQQPTGKSKLSQDTPGSKGKNKNQGLNTPPRLMKTSKKILQEESLIPLKPQGVAALREHKRMESSTPYRLRKRNLDLGEPASSSDDSVDSSSDDNDEGDEEELESKDAKTKNTFKQKRTADFDTNMAANAETYFDLHAMAPITSDRTLSTLEGPRLDVDSIRQALKEHTPSHHSQISALVELHARLFKRWMLNMCSGFNILLYGLGSKRNLLDRFREEYLIDFPHLLVNGYFPSLTAKHILNSITEEILESPKGFTNVYSQLEFIKESYKYKDKDFYLIINNIDGVLLRSEKSQAILSSLAEINGFHIVASVDHINAPLMWDQDKFCRFRWLWYETATFQNYEAENSYENSLMVQQSGSLALSSIVHVMRSLTPNARQVFLMLAEYQLEMGGNPNYAGMSFQSLYHKCREAFLVNSDLTLQAQLVEFKDHRLIRSKKNFEGIEHLTIPIDHSTLKEFLQEHKTQQS